jgi:hypothetical protein
MNIKIHSQGWKGSSPTKKGETSGAMFGGLLEIDGEIYDRVNDIRLDCGDQFATVTVTFVPGSVDVVNHTEETWPKLLQEVQARDARAAARTGDGRMIAIYVSPENNDE